MFLIDKTYQTEEENLAFDESLLNLAELGQIESCLRFWESESFFIVLGSSNKVKTETFESQAQDKSIKILRRSSGGGTVVQGPGCVSYALVMQLKDNHNLSNIQSSNNYIMEQNRKAIEDTLNSPITLSGSTDLAHDNLKFSGNSQRRRRNALLFHGTFLYDFNLDLISDILSHPSSEPEYRQKRSHKEFLKNIKLSRTEIINALKKKWQASTEFPWSIQDQAEREMKNLVESKYSQEWWNKKF